MARNVAENLARLGQPVKLVSVVGKDRPGDELLEYTASAGVDVSAVLRTDLYPTGFYMGVLDPRARLRFAVDDMRVMSELTPEYLQQNQALFENASLVFVDGNLPEASLRAAAAMVSGSVSLSVSPYAFLVFGAALAGGVVAGWFVAALILAYARGAVHCPRCGTRNARGFTACRACGLHSS